MSMYFVKHSMKSASNVNATPLKIMIGQYEISLAGDNNFGSSGSKLDRMDIAVFLNGEIIETIYSPEFDDLVEIVQKYRKINEEEIENEEHQ